MHQIAYRLAAGLCRDPAITALDPSDPHSCQSINQSINVYLRAGFYNKKIQNQWHGLRYATLDNVK